MAALSLKTIVGVIEIVEDNAHITAVHGLSAQRHPDTPSPLLREAARQLEAYFSGKLETFDLPLAPKGSAFHQAVFQIMSAIPYGETLTYGDIAGKLNTYGQPVGQACGANPIPIIIPCHRVLSANGLGGYSGAGGLDTKITLLKLEGGYPFLV